MKERERIFFESTVRHTTTMTDAVMFSLSFDATARGEGADSISQQHIVSD